MLAKVLKSGLKSKAIRVIGWFFCVLLLSILAIYFAESLLLKSIYIILGLMLIEKILLNILIWRRRHDYLRSDLIVLSNTLIGRLIGKKRPEYLSYALHNISKEIHPEKKVTCKLWMCSNKGILKLPTIDNNEKNKSLLKKDLNHFVNEGLKKRIIKRRIKDFEEYSKNYFKYSIPLIMFIGMIVIGIQSDIGLNYSLATLSIVVLTSLILHPKLVYRHWKFKIGYFPLEVS